LASSLYAAGTNLSRSVSSVGEHQSDAYISPTLPKRAETFGGFDNANKDQLAAATVKGVCLFLSACLFLSVCLSVCLCAYVRLFYTLPFQDTHLSYSNVVEISFSQIFKHLLGPLSLYCNSHLLTMTN